MKYILITSCLFCITMVNAQTIPAPPYYPAPSPVYNYPQNNGTPMVRNPIENNNPSVQASIPILNKPSSLEADRGGYSIAASNRIIYNNVHQNTSVKNMATVGTANVPTFVAASSIASDTTFRSAGSLSADSSVSIVKTTVIYNNTTGTDISKTVDKISAVTTKTNNTVPLRQTYIAEAVVNKFKMLYGENLYDIRQVRYGSNNTIYLVRIIKEGLFNSMYLNEEGEIVRQ